MSDFLARLFACWGPRDKNNYEESQSPGRNGVDLPKKNGVKVRPK